MLTLVAVISIAATACSSGGHGAKGTPRSTIPKVVNAATVAADATRAVHGARLNGTITDGEGHVGKVDGTWAGGPREKGNGDIDLQVPLGATFNDVEIRWTNGSVYVRRAIARANTVTNAFQLPLYRTAGQQEWSQGSASGLGVNFITNAFDPPSLLDLIGGIARPLESSATIDGKPVTELKSAKPVIVGLWTGASVGVFVDNRHRAVRVKITSPDGGTSYDLTNFGATVDVPLPPASDIALSTNVRIQLATAFQLAASGTTNGVRWRLLSAPTTDGQVCWRWDATPPIEQVGANGPQRSRCITPPRADAPLEEHVRFPVESNGLGSYNALVALVPNAPKALDLGFVGGLIEPQKLVSPLVWIGPTSKTPAYLGITMPNGTHLDCGAGPVGSPADLKDSSLTGSAATDPWTCARPS